ncbi:electron transport complex protein RnfC [Isorropodon fossajaponicum endosymbiont JTNG4]|uniref:electron transport complex subunit RsxC n=1 Tax=Isorropodon fossajaponicum symbiont TaxID=883811 RepID=UPI001916339C|nr:electron transport complex subunit RsxC [Isorropodon fossajaponicum symbiont]BBB23708.1 electron transport complex protein RnfC [Isorropodon fossajaponicum endosymbiont JTNG4]
MADYSFNGGIVIRNPYPVDKVEIIQAPLPKKVIIPLQQRIGEQAKPCVSVGDYVLTGQVIASTEDSFGVFIHASVSGVVLSIDKQVIPHKSGLKSQCITIESDGQDKWIDNSGCSIDFLHCSAQTIIDYIQKSGIVGLGGAGFPTHAKLGKIKQCYTLIINGTECEPGVMCDDALMQLHPREIIRGVEILLHICGAKRAIVAIEDDKQAAYQALLMFNHNDKISINQIPTKYTSGAEKLLIKALLGIEISSGGFAMDRGIACQNVATTKAIFDAVVNHKPLVSRIVTVTGSGVKPNNFEVRLGTSFESLISMASPSQKVHDYRMGGMMMGVDVADIQTPICKITNAIFVNNHIQKPAIQECIRCGQCSEVCPVGLLPQQLYWHAKSENIEKALNYNLLDCIECACCDYVCPSHIPLANYFSFAKALNKQQTREQVRINIARERFEFREYRLERNKLERARMMADKKKALKEKMAKEQSQKQKIAEAIQRVQQAKDKK